MRYETVNCSAYLKKVSYPAVGAGAPGGGRREYIPIGFRPASMPVKPPPGAPAPTANVVSYRQVLKFYC
ncbi:MAG: hypothetical protein ABSB19_00110 [Methylomonas sp.]|jgi:hypothetical protein